MTADGTVAPPAGPPHDPGMEARVAPLEEDVGEIKTTLRRLEPMIVRMDAVIPHLLTKAEVEALRSELRGEIGDVKASLAAMPSKAYLWGILATLIAAYACGLAALAALK